MEKPCLKLADLVWYKEADKDELYELRGQF